MPGAGLNIADIRKDYRLSALDEATVGDDPLIFFTQWFTEAGQAQITEVNAMTLATADAHHRPHARIVLLKGVDDKGFLFYTNYDSAKGRDIMANPYAALVFFWKELERQVRIEGILEKTTASESDAYFHSRPVGSQIGAWASPQSSPVKDRNILEQNYDRYQKKFSDKEIPRPPLWGGYRVIPDRIEYWQGRSSRMHDRILFSLINGIWHKSRLAP